MKKLIGKTIAITVASVLGFFAVFSVFAVLFCPRVFGKMFENTGNYGASIWCYERQFDISGSVEDLTAIILNLKDEDFVKIDKYSQKLLEHKDYSEYIQGEGKKLFLEEIIAEEFFYRKAVVSRYQVAGIDSAILSAKTFVDRLGYTSSNPYRGLVALKSDMLSIEDLTKIQQELQTIKNSLQLDEQVLIEQDIQEIQILITNKGE